MGRFFPPALRSCALASGLLMAGTNMAGSSLPEGTPRVPAPDTRPVVCLTDSAFGAEPPLLCFSLMDDIEISLRKARGGAGRVGLWFHKTVTVPRAMPERVIDIRDERLPERYRWALGVCWARIDDMTARGARVPAGPCID